MQFIRTLQSSQVASFSLAIPPLAGRDLVAGFPPGAKTELDLSAQPCAGLGAFCTRLAAVRISAYAVTARSGEPCV